MRLNFRISVFCAFLLFAPIVCASSAQEQEKDTKPAEKPAEKAPETPPAKEESSVTDHTIKIALQGHRRHNSPEK